MPGVVRKSLVVVASMLTLASCGDADESAADASAGNQADASAGAADGALDASATECLTPQECPCFSNYDCPSTHVCESQDETGENVFCVVGARGVGVAGDPCTGEASCASALCIESDSGSFCSDICEDASTCPAVLPTCLYIGFGVDESICAP